MKRSYSLWLAVLMVPAFVVAQTPPKPPVRTDVPNKMLFPPTAVTVPGKVYGMPLEHTYITTEPKFYTTHDGVNAYHFAQEPKFYSTTHAEVAYADYARYGVAGEVHFARPPQYFQGDPADSLYRVAWAMFQRQEYRPAADRFAEVRTKFPTTRYFCDASYYEAFSRYRLGNPNDLRTGNRVLEAMGTRCSTAARREDVPQLAGRIDGRLAQLGDQGAIDRVRQKASSGENACDSEERTVKITALSALAGMDAQAAMPVLRAVLATKDVCSAPIRQQAIQLVARRNDAEAVAILNQVARNDPDPQTQYAAVRSLSQMQNEAAFAAIEDYMKTATDERIQTQAAMAYASNENPRAQAAVRALIERKDVAERIRISAINSMGSRSNLSLEYWRGLYTKMESDELRKAVLSAIARIQTEEAQTFLLSVARNPNEGYAARAYALSRISANAPINELYRVLETADGRSMRTSIVNSLAARREPEATDRLIDITKTSTDPEVVNAAIRALSQPHRRTDPKVVKALQDLLTVRG